MCQVENYILKFDGACGPKNPGGTATYGFVLYHNGKKIDDGHGIVSYGPNTSNNMAEHAAVSKGMEAFIRHYKFAFLNQEEKAKLHIIGDSQLIIHHLNGVWRIRPKKLYYEYALKSIELINKIKAFDVTVQCTWTPREQNEECDTLSKIDL
jgi:ribonuclease HI